MEKGRKYTLKELRDMPTILQAHGADLKVSQINLRVWLSRMTAGDGAPYDYQVIVEAWSSTGACWIEVDRYQALVPVDVNIDLLLLTVNARADRFTEKEMLEILVSWSRNRTEENCAELARKFLYAIGRDDMCGCVLCRS